MEPTTNGEKPDAVSPSVESASDVARIKWNAVRRRLAEKVGDAKQAFDDARYDLKRFDDCTRNGHVGHTMGQATYSWKRTARCTMTGTDFVVDSGEDYQPPERNSLAEMFEGFEKVVPDWDTSKFLRQMWEEWREEEDERNAADCHEDCD